jgi:pimeloyl-ACP methyl ester carboxylesterase
MATFVMIHGAWHGGWCFDILKPLLEAPGHRMVAPDLPGMGGDEAALAAVTLADWAEFTADLCRQAHEPVILCGHSRGGIVISEAAERAPDSIAALVYICAMLLPTGVSREEVRKISVPNPAFNAIRFNVAGGTVIDPAHAPAVFAQLSPEHLAKSAAARLLTEPFAPSATTLQLTDARYGSVPRHYIECIHDLTIPIEDQRRMQSEQPCLSVTSLDADHSPFLSRPVELSKALLSISERYAG